MSRKFVIEFLQWYAKLSGVEYTIVIDDKDYYKLGLVAIGYEARSEFNSDDIWVNPLLFGHIEQQIKSRYAAFHLKWDVIPDQYTCEIWMSPTSGASVRAKGETALEALMRCFYLVTSELIRKGVIKHEPTT